KLRSQFSYKIIAPHEPGGSSAGHLRGRTFLQLSSCSAQFLQIAKLKLPRSKTGPGIRRTPSCNVCCKERLACVSILKEDRCMYHRKTGCHPGGRTAFTLI